MPAVVALLHPDEQRRVVDEGHEFAMHGWDPRDNSQLTETVERDLMRRAHETLAKIAGRPPVGVRVPSWNSAPTTLGLIRELGLLYDSSLMADDEPYEILEDGEPTGIVELPVESIKDDAPYLGMNRASTIRCRAAVGGAGDLQGGVRRSGGRGRATCAIPRTSSGTGRESPCSPI